MNNGEECHMSTFNRPNIDYEIRYKDAMVSIEYCQYLYSNIF